MNDNNFYAALLSIVIILILAILLLLIIYKLLTGISAKELKEKGKAASDKLSEQGVKKSAIKKKGINYRERIKEMAEADPEFVASKLKKWLKEK